MAPRTMLAVTLLAQAWGFEVEPATPRRKTADATTVSPEIPASGGADEAPGTLEPLPRAPKDRTTVLVQLLTKSTPRASATPR